MSINPAQGAFSDGTIADKHCDQSTVLYELKSNSGEKKSSQTYYEEESGKKEHIVRPD